MLIEGVIYVCLCGIRERSSYHQEQDYPHGEGAHLRVVYAQPVVALLAR